MERSTVSSCHSLRILPISRLANFARYGSRVLMVPLGEPDDAVATPGSVMVSTEAENGVNRKKITYERSDVSVETSDLLDRYKKVRIVATYVDESGLTRIAGSPSYPLSLDYTTADGVYIITLTGEDSEIDAFLDE